MLKVANSGKNHGDTMFVGSVDHFLIADGPTGLDDRGDSRLRGGIDGVPEREKRIGRHDTSPHFLVRLFDRETRRIDTAHLARANAHRFAAAHIDDGV